MKYIKMISPGIWLNIFWVCLRRSFWMRLISIWTGRLKKADFPSYCEWVSSNRRKTQVGQTIWVRGTPFCLTDMSWCIGLFWLQIQTEILALLVVGSATFQPETYIISSPASQAFGFTLEAHIGSSGCAVGSLQILGLVDVHNCMSRFLITKL